MKRTHYLERKTRETEITLDLDLDGSGKTDIATGIGFLDHMLSSLVFHAGFDLTLRCRGDLHVDDHHTAEDCALALGEAFRQCLGDRQGIERFGQAYVPLDEALSRAVIDLSGRPFAVVELGLRREKLGMLSTENISHVLRSLATSMGAALHVTTLYGENDHHRAESAFKATALALRGATAIRETRKDEIPSLKGTLE